jgi:transposase
MNTKLKNNYNSNNESTLLDSDTSIIYAGIDVHKAQWTVTIYVNDRLFKTFTQPPSAEALYKTLSNNFPGCKYKACYEAGFCGFVVQRDLDKLGIECIVINPADLPKTSKNMYTKTDTIDSKILSEFLSKNLLRSIYIPKRSDESDRALVRYRKVVVKDLGSSRRRVKSLLMSKGILVPEKFQKSYICKKYLEWLQTVELPDGSLRDSLDLILDDVIHFRKKLLQINKQIKTLSCTDKYKGICQILMSAPGIGTITSMTLITEIMDISRFKHFKNFNSYVGLYPTEYSSGEHIRKGFITPRNNKFLRPLIIEAAWSAIQRDGILALKFAELTKRMTKKRAIVAIARKLLSRIYSIWNDGVLYELNKK